MLCFAKSVLFHRFTYAACFTLWERLLRDRCLKPYRITPIHWLMTTHVVSLYRRMRHLLTKRSYCPSVLRFFWPKYHIRMRFISDDLSVIQRHRRFLRFAFGGKAYQYKVLPFGPFEAPGHSCAELSGRLAHSGSLQGASKSS